MMSWPLMWMIMKAYGRDKVDDDDVMPHYIGMQRAGESMEMHLEGERSI